jgi:beta-ureidopropionase / N-carbamoyl-L-amino-acid hydrolase
MSFDALWDDLLDVGRDATSGGYHRFTGSAAERTCREWFLEQAAARGLVPETDRNANLWAWHRPDAPGGALVTGSHLDSVPDGGAYDGPLGVIAAFAAFDSLAARDALPAVPFAIVAFAEEEGARFGLPCLGSRLLTGALPADRVLARRDADGAVLAEVWAALGASKPGPDPQRLARIGVYLELHVEQGRGLVHSGHAVGLASALRPHGRWRLSFHGAPDHAGTTALLDRLDPMLTVARCVMDVREAATRHKALATVGRLRVVPNATNVIPSLAEVWVDARAGDEAAVRAVVDDVVNRVAAHATLDGISVDVVEESWSPAVHFDAGLTGRLSALLGGAPVLDSGAGHDAGVLAAAGVPSAMLFVRNPTGVSHAPAEHAERDDCLAGVAALADCIRELAP